MLPFVLPFLLLKTLGKYYIYYIGNIIIRSPHLAHGAISHILFLYFLFIYRCVYMVLPILSCYRSLQTPDFTCFFIKSRQHLTKWIYTIFVISRWYINHIIPVLNACILLLFLPFPVPALHIPAFKEPCHTLFNRIPGFL